MQRVLVTRPEPGASRTAARLKVLGFVPVVLPLTRIEPVPPADWPAPSKVGAVAIASANAVRHAPAGRLRGIAHLPTYAVGEKTGAAAREAGLAVADAGAGDAESLVQRIAAAMKGGTCVLILCGRVRRDGLEEGLLQAGFAVELVETYDTLPLSPSQTDIDAVLERAPVEAVLFYSAFAAAEFARLIARTSTAGPFDGARYFAISERVAERLPETVQNRVHIAREPTEEAVLSMLAEGM